MTLETWTHMRLQAAANTVKPEQLDLEITPFNRLFEAEAVTTHFQPIFSVRQKSIVGMEALSRGKASNGRLIAPYDLFKMAAEADLTAELERLCRKTAVQTFSSLASRPDELLLFLNLDLAATDDPEELPGALAKLVRDANLLPRNVAVEFLEARLEDVGRFGALADALRGHGFLVVLDDVGAGHSNLDRIPLFRPDVIKVDRSLISGVREDFYKQETLKSLVSLSRRIGALVVAEGIETEAEAIVALELGADLLQGFFLSRPQPATAFDDGVRVSSGIERLAHRFKGHMVNEINERKRQHRRFNVIQNGILCDLTNAQASEFDEILLHLIDDFPKVECVYVLDDAGVQVTETICNTAVKQRPGAAMFRPARKGTDHSLKEYYYVLIDVELQKYTTDPYVSLASGNLCRTISTCFRDATNNRLYILCVDVNP
jgi:EAL domain-containing protein (putative c-di-GMP-specific phosphodiesterase class I)